MSACMARTQSSLGRVVLIARDRELLKCRHPTHGYGVGSTDTLHEAKKVLRRFDGARQVEPSARCLVCGDLPASAAKEAVQASISPLVAAWKGDCLGCVGRGEPYGEGTHHPRLRTTEDRILEEIAVPGTG